ncbi:MAG TPA: hypothetical protein VHH91_07210, partial [Vicinamibacterales bacterium]|nr:hypothetical protein [Vicinamibacterales bacterium]
DTTARLVYEAARRADAMGILDADTVQRFDVPTARRVAERARAAGVGRVPVAELAHFEVPSPAEVQAVLRLLITALEQSPVPQLEWRSVSRVFDPEQLASLLAISLSSLRRYQSGERATPDDVAARLHFLALVTGDLAGAYNEIGIRRWFGRKRTQLGGKTPASFLTGTWDPDDAGPQKVRSLGAALVTLSAT